MLCLCMVSCSIGRLCHLLRFIYLVYLSLWVFVSFLFFIFMSFSLLSHSRYAFGVLRVHVRVLWDPMLLGSWLIYIRYERWVIFLLGSPDHCLTHHSIIGDMTFSYCTDMDWSSVIPLSYCLTLYLLTHFQIFVPLFIHFLHIDTHFCFDTFFTSFTCFIDGLTTHLSLILPSTFPLVTFRSMAHEIYLCITSCTRGYGFDHWVFEPSFPSFLSPYHLGLRYVPCLKTTLRPWDQMLSLTAST